MSILPKTPLTDDDGEVAELGDNFFNNAIRFSDFANDREAHAFLARRDQLARIADDLGMSREAWEALLPNKPGFEDRFSRILEETAARVRAVAAE